MVCIMFALMFTYRFLVSMKYIMQLVKYFMDFELHKYLLDKLLDELSLPHSMFR